MSDDTERTISEDDCPYCGGCEEVEATLFDGSRECLPCPHACHRRALTTPAAKPSEERAREVLAHEYSVNGYPSVALAIRERPAGPYLIQIKAMLAFASEQFAETTNKS